MARRRRPSLALVPALATVLALAVVLAPAGGRPGTVHAADDATAARPHAAPDVPTALRRGVAHLVATQRPDGSWGSTASNLWDIYAPVPGAFHAFQAACTGLAVSALLEAGEGEPGAAEAVRRGTEWLLAHHAVRRVSPDTLYNVWGHAYALEAFARLLARERDESRRSVLKRAAEEAIARITRFRFVEGGWGYYDFDVGAALPGPGSTTFTTATVLVAVPEPLVRSGLALMRYLRNPDDSFAYSYDHRYYPQGGINQIKGSLARTPACLVAFRDWRPEEATDAQLIRALDRLEEHGHFLLIARKYPRPHESWYQNSGYFAFYGYYYAALSLDRLPAEARPEQARRLAARLLPLQEEDGSFWDYQLYGYHKAYGTAYVLLALSRCRG
jgi:hypothetical protein